MTVEVSGYAYPCAQRTRELHPICVVFHTCKFGKWSIDEVTGEHGYIDFERSCFLDIGRQQGSPDCAKVAK